jgi:hypothetical protein
VRVELLDEPQRNALSALRPAAERGFYLAGGTGLCLRLGHRRSLDLDLFRPAPFDPAELVRELACLGTTLAHVKLSPGTVQAELCGVRTVFFSYHYPLLEPPDELEPGVPVAGLRDIAAMKIEAIASRGARKDFYDLYFLGKAGIGLPEALAAFAERFASASPELYHRLRSLTDFDVAESEPEPRLVVPVRWTDVRHYFEEQARALWQTLP